MDRPNLYAEQINDLIKSPGRLEQKLTFAISRYEQKIMDLRAKALLSDNSDLTRIYQSSVSIVERTLKFLSSAESFEVKFADLALVARDIYRHVKPAIEQYEETRTRLRFTELKDFLDYHDSLLDAARLLNDEELLVDALRQYAAFVYLEVSSDPRCLPALLGQAALLDNFMSTLCSVVVSFERLLSEMGFPVLPSSAFEETDSQKWDDEQLKRFGCFYKRLCSLKITHLNFLLERPLSDVVSLPMQIILSSLEKRFRYHFTGTRKTNRVDKPEWYMTQILQWIRENDYVLTMVDRDFVREGYTRQKLRIEFMRGLVTLLVDKLQFDIGLSVCLDPRYQLEWKLRSGIVPDHFSKPNLTTKLSVSTELTTNAEYFGHLIDVILQTDARLTQLAYPLSDQPRPSDVLTLPAVLGRWISLEQQLALSRLDALLTTANAWAVVDETNLRPQCADDFMALLHAIGVRGRHLTDKLARTRFLRVQLYLIKVFYSRLKDCARIPPDTRIGSADRISAQNSRDTTDSTSFGAVPSRLGRLFNVFGQRKSSVPSLSNTPSVFTSWFESTAHHGQSTRWVAVLNALNFIQDTLFGLANDPYYVAFWEEDSTRTLLQMADPWMSDLGFEGEMQLDVSSLQSTSDILVSMDSMLAISRPPGGLHGGVFNKVILLYQSGMDEMLEETVQAVMREIEQLSHNYTNCADYWLRAGPVSGHVTGGLHVDAGTLELSGAASGMLIRLRDQLFYLSKSLHPRLFVRAWQKIAHSMDDLVYHKLILRNRFTPAGAAQLWFDLAHCLFPMFALYTDRPEAHFAQSRDASILLNLLRGSAELLRSTLKERLTRTSATDQEMNKPLAPLLELGVYSLTPDEAERVLALRSGPY
ncbi:RAD50-interacting protein 1 [Paragonimus westermani]|uniref:RAD50-interacting protein 1 n=1 Tax=Paragonimus westermani TaxID=34504 RepID=A0A5J4NWX9_9TREM|nr:RAD50-interacting protein 1 [Paragonimus westermani]